MLGPEIGAPECLLSTLREFYHFMRARTTLVSPPPLFSCMAGAGLPVRARFENFGPLPARQGSHSRAPARLPSASRGLGFCFLDTMHREQHV